MLIKKMKLLSALVAACTVSVAYTQQAFGTTLYYASPTGASSDYSGVDPCPIAHPCSLTHAKSKANGSGGDVKVILRGGVYQLTSTLTFTNTDSGAAAFGEVAALPVIYQPYGYDDTTGQAGESVVISGGTAIETTWMNAYGNYSTTNNSGIFWADISTLPDDTNLPSDTKFRQLYAVSNGKADLLTRSREPDTDYFYAVDTPDSAMITVSGRRVPPDILGDVENYCTVDSTPSSWPNNFNTNWNGVCGLKTLQDVGALTSSASISTSVGAMDSSIKAELVIYNYWNNSHHTIQSIERADGITTIKLNEPAYRHMVTSHVRQPCDNTVDPDCTHENHYDDAKNQADVGKGVWHGAPFLLQNALSFVDEGGEWFYDTANKKLYYKPKAGEVLNNMTFVIPAVDHLMEFNNAHDIEFRGISFRYGRYNLPPAEDVNVGTGVVHYHAETNSRLQSPNGVPIGSAIVLTDSSHITFAHGEAAYMGGWAFSMLQGSNNTIDHMHIHHVGAGAVLLDGYNASYTTNGQAVTEGAMTDAMMQYKMLPNQIWNISCAMDYISSDNDVTHNNIHEYGLDFPATPAVYARCAMSNHLSYNNIHHGFYSGIATGGLWKDNADVSGDNEIIFNRIHDLGKVILGSNVVVKQMMNDFGGIYLFHSTDDKVENNVIYNIYHREFSKGGYGAYSLYLDQAIKTSIKNNLFYEQAGASADMGSSGIHIGGGYNRAIIENNVFYNSPLSAIELTYCAGKKNCRDGKAAYIRHNIFVLPAGVPVFTGAEAQDTSYTKLISYYRDSNNGGKLVGANLDSDNNLFYRPGTQNFTDGNFRCFFHAGAAVKNGVVSGQGCYPDVENYTGAQWQGAHGKDKNSNFPTATPGTVTIDPVSGEIDPVVITNANVPGGFENLNTGPVGPDCTPPPAICAWPH